MKTYSNHIIWFAGIGLFLATLDTGIINIALPSLQTAWHTNTSTVTWTVAAYTVTLAGTVLFWGQFADRIGPERIFLLGLIVFTLASAACGAAPSLEWLIGARAVQGLGSAMIQGTAAALVTIRIPDSRRTLALGTLAMFQGLGPVIGPTVGGLLLTWSSWRGLFWVNIPVTLPLIVLLARYRVPRSPRSNTRFTLDIPGNVLLMLTVTGGLLALTLQSESRTFWCLFTAISALSLIGWERRAPYPLIPRTIWRSPAFWSAIGAILMVGGATSIVFMVPPYTLRLMAHLAAWQVGLINMSAPLMLVAFSRPASRLIGRWSPSRLMLGGLIIMMTSFTILMVTAKTQSIVIMVLVLGVYGLGAAAFFPSNLASLLSTAGLDSHGVLGALQRMAINVGTAVDVTITGALLDVGTSGPHPLSIQSIRMSFAYGAGTLFLAIVGVWLARSKQCTNEKQVDQLS